MKRIAFIFSLLAPAILSGQIYLDPAADTKSRVADLLGRMTLEEKIGQMTQAERAGVISSNLEDVRDFYLGSVLSGGGSTPSPNTGENWVNLYNSIQERATATRLGIPVIYGIDAVHGHNNLKNAVIFPHNIGIGCSRDTELARKCARITALEVKATGLNWTFSPCIAVPRNEFWGRTYEGFGEMTGLVDSMGTACIRAYQTEDLANENSLLACAKHFLGDGGTENGIDQGNTKIPEQELREIHLKPYIGAIDAGVGSIMVSFSSWNGIKCHANKYLLSDILKKELGFEGFVVSDWNGINQLDPDFKKAIEQAINAGIDMAMQPNNYKEFIQNLKELVNEGKVSDERIDDAVSRILRVKFEMGLFENYQANLDLIDTVGCNAHRKIAREAVRKSVVLLKNQGILPLSKESGKILVAGRKAKDIGVMCGGWTISWQGSTGAITEGTTIYEGIQDVIGDERLEFTDSYNLIPDADYAIVVVGEQPYAESRGDIYPAEPSKFGLSFEEKEMIKAIKGKNIPVVVVLISGRPLDISDELMDSEAFLASWLPGSEGGSGIADILFGDYSPTGKLSHTWPESYYDVPLNAGNIENQNVLFPYGYGLGYDKVNSGKDFISSGTIRLFPNPADEAIFLEITGFQAFNIKLTDINGKVIVDESHKLSGYLSIPVSHIQPGIYILSVKGDNKTVVKKVIIR